MKRILLLLFLIPLVGFSQSDFEVAKQLFMEKKWEQSKVIFEKVAASEPTNLKVLEYLGDIAGHRKTWDEALLYYGKLKRVKPAEAEYHYKYGGVLGMKALEVNKFKALTMIDDIKGSFEKAIQLNPQHIPSRWALIQLYIKLPGIVGGSELKAIRYANELLKISPVDGYLSRGHIEEYYKRYKNAEIQYKKAINVGNSKICYQKLADLYQNKMNQPEKALEILQLLKNNNSIPKKNI